MNTECNYNDLSEFLAKHNASNRKEGESPTHTRIGSKTLNVYGGSYAIDKDSLPTFYRLYYDHIFVKHKKEYLTEKQLDDDGGICIDLDLHYPTDVTERQHTAEHIQDFVTLVLEQLKEFFIFRANEPFPIFIMEKPNVNREADKTKDGIHIIIGIQMDKTMKSMLREKLVKEIADIWDLPLANDWEGVVDGSVMKGHANWQMYGSQKPGHEAYKLTYYIVGQLNDGETQPIALTRDLKEFNLSKNFTLLSAQYDKHVKFEMNPDIRDEYLAAKKDNSSAKTKKRGTKGKGGNVILEEEGAVDDVHLSDITNFDILNTAMNNILASLKLNEQHIKEIHEYTQILPAKYYDPGSHLLNRQVAFALKNTDERLFLSWIMLRSKASDFDYGTIPELYNNWQTHFNKKANGVTKGSIIYWAKQDAFEEYEKVKKSNIRYYIEETIFEAGDWDYAMVLYQMFKDKYVCSSIVNKKWFVFNNHRWEEDKGLRLRLAISKDLYQLYLDIQNELLGQMQSCDASSDEHTKYQKKCKEIGNILIKLKKTNDKNNIMREAMEIFFDKDFTKNMDANPYLLCFNNGVFDFKTKQFRQGYPQDYITKTTGVGYTPYNYEKNKQTMDDIENFMKQLFPQPTLCKYMWDHLASCLIGIKKEHAFNIYRGSGSNGKSILTELMSHCLGDYKGTVPITLVTEKRNSIGGTSSEIIQLKGVRYAVMQEPSKDAVINEGIMKELTGGDPIQARALYSDSEIFIPQFTLAVCTNALFEIKSNDDGTWRRMKLVDFVAKFVSEGEVYTDNTEYIFPKDKSLKEKLPQWAPIFMSILVKRACETDGEVKDCQEVIAASCKYRQSQDCISAFISERIVASKSKNDYLNKKLLNDEFTNWFAMNFGKRKQPKLTEVIEILINKYGKPNGSGRWNTIAIKYDEDDADDNNFGN
jgi:P4 family phage/plasmid primase-like protien